MFQIYKREYARQSIYAPRIYKNGDLVCAKEFLLKSNIKQFTYCDLYTDHENGVCGLHFTNKKGEFSYKCTLSDDNVQVGTGKFIKEKIGNPEKSFAIPFKVIETGEKVDKKRLLTFTKDDVKKLIESNKDK